MEQVSYSDFAERVHARVTKDFPTFAPTKVDVRRIIDAALKELRFIMASGAKATLYKFGTFWAKEREATNPSAYATGKGPVRINTVVAKFKASDALKNEIKKGFGLK